MSSEDHEPAESGPHPDWAYDESGITERIRSKTTHPSCPVCDADLWFIPKSLNVLFPGPQPDGSTESTVALRVLPFICTNCGYVRMHFPDLELLPQEGSDG